MICPFSLRMVGAPRHHTSLRCLQSEIQTWMAWAYKRKWRPLNWKAKIDRQKPHRMISVKSSFKITLGPPMSRGSPPGRQRTSVNFRSCTWMRPAGATESNSWPLKLWRMWSMPVPFLIRRMKEGKISSSNNNRWLHPLFSINIVRSRQRATSSSSSSKIIRPTFRARKLFRCRGITTWTLCWRSKTLEISRWRMRISWAGLLIQECRFMMMPLLTMWTTLFHHVTSKKILILWILVLQRIKNSRRLPETSFFQIWMLYMSGEYP